MISVLEFSAQHPQYSVDFSVPIKHQPRVYLPSELALVPEELAPSHEYRSGGRGRPNLNQTLTHWQCTSCKRVLRNDFFYSSPSFIKRNVLSSHCISCSQEVNANWYRKNSSLIRSRRTVIWQYLAPQCAICGFNKHTSAIDMHHLGAKEGEIAALITEVTFTPNAHKIERLLYESRQCIALCSNCHRMLHANVIDIEQIELKIPSYSLVELTKLLQEAEMEISNE